MLLLAIWPRATSDHRSIPNDLRPRYSAPAGFTPFVSTNPTWDCIFDISQRTPAGNRGSFDSSGFQAFVLWQEIGVSIQMLNVIVISNWHIHELGTVFSEW